MKDAMRRYESWTLEEWSLLFEFRQLAFKIVQALLQTLIIQTEHIQAIQQLFTLDNGPFQRALQSDQLKLCLSPLIQSRTHARASVDGRLPVTTNRNALPVCCRAIIE
jgi:hypothetical protein